MTQAITPTSAVNKLLIQIEVDASNSGSQNLTIALFQDATVNALKAKSQTSASGTNMEMLAMNHFMTA